MNSNLHTDAEHQRRVDLYRKLMGESTESAPPERDDEGQKHDTMKARFETLMGRKETTP